MLNLCFLCALFALLAFVLMCVSLFCLLFVLLFASDCLPKCLFIVLGFYVLNLSTRGRLSRGATCHRSRSGQCSRRVCRSRSSSVDAEYTTEKHICKTKFAASTRQKAERMLKEYSPRTSTYKCVDRIEGQDLAFDTLKQKYPSQSNKTKQKKKQQTSPFYLHFV